MSCAGVRLKAGPELVESCQGGLKSQKPVVGSEDGDVVGTRGSL